MRFIFHKGITRNFLFIVLLIPVILFSLATYASRDSTYVHSDFSEEGPVKAPVKIDGKILFEVRGMSSYPAALRAQVIMRRIETVAVSKSISPDSLKLLDEADKTRIYAGSEPLMNVFNEDASLENVNRQFLAELYRQRIATAIRDFRHERSRPVVLKHALTALGEFILMLLLLFVVYKGTKSLNRIFQNRIKQKVDSLESMSFNLIKSKHLWNALRLLFKVINLALTILIVAIFTTYILELFPWTKDVPEYTSKIVLGPFKTIGTSFINFLPSLVLLVVIFLVTRYILKLVGLFFTGIHDGGILLKDFDQDWAMPTFRIVKFILIILALVVAYPYIPGTSSDAFKGISVFLGILFSLGSSSFISNVVAGYSMTYRKAFKVGDRIKVDEIVGIVLEQSILVTRLRTVKNEEIIIPNSTLLNSNILNYTAGARNLGIIIHSEVGIGYQVPWRLVHSMLLLAADRTDGLLKEPVPFVLQRSLGDFAVKYEINAYCPDPGRLLRTYSELHQNILDIFNENNVQIMTPAYEGDPESAKVVPKERWKQPIAGEKKPKDSPSEE